MTGGGHVPPLARGRRTAGEPDRDRPAGSVVWASGASSGAESTGSSTSAAGDSTTYGRSSPIRLESSEARLAERVQRPARTRTRVRGNRAEAAGHASARSSPRRSRRAAPPRRNGTGSGACGRGGHAHRSRRRRHLGACRRLAPRAQARSNPVRGGGLSGWPHAYPRRRDPGPATTASTADSWCTTRGTTRC